MAGVVLHLPNGNLFGPYRCNRDFAADQLSGAKIKIETVAEQLNSLLNLPPQRLGNTCWWCAPPKITYEYILVLVRPSESTNVTGDSGTVESHVYVVEMKPRQGMSVDMIKSYVYDVFGPNALSEDSLRCYKSTEDEQLFFSGSVLVANPPPSQQSPIKPDDNQPMVKPSEESPTPSFHSCRGSFGNQQSLILLPAVPAVPQQLDEEQLPHQQNTPFICLCNGDDVGEIKTKTESDVVNVMPCEDKVDIAGISHNEGIGTGNRTPGMVEQDLVFGQTPLKLLQHQKAMLARNKKTETDNELDEEEYRSLHLEQFKFTEEEERRNIDKESASFPGACHRRIRSWNQVREQQLEVGFIYKQEDSEMDESDGVSQNQEESESEMKELQHKVHVLEHIYNKECFLKDQCKKPPSSESFQEVERMTRAYEGGKLDPKLMEVLKRYIMAHCQRCSDPFCKVPHMAAGCPHPGVPSNLELSCSQSVSSQSQVHVPSDDLSGIPQNSQLQHLQQCHKFTDGKKIFMQATDNDTPSLYNRVYVGLGRPRMSEEQPTENCGCADNGVVDPQVTDAELQSPEMIRNGYFPSVDTCRCQLDSLIKRLVYCHEELSESTGLTFGSAIADSLQVSQCIGKGGNGTVYNCFLQKRQLAAKLTHYRQRELCIWSGLKHDNVIALLGLVLVPLHVDRGVYVYQLMPLMTSSFHKEVDRVDNLHTLICTKKMPSSLVLGNVHHIFKEALRGLGYLHRNLVYHGDIKGSNIFITKRRCCCCVSSLLCECPAEFKCHVCIGDFDTAGYFTPSDDGDGVSDRIKTLHMGTPFYRSPEAHIGHMGPWCDMWGIGCLILYVTLGHSTTTALKKECGEINRDPAVVHQYNPLLVLLAENRNISRLQHHMQDLCKVYPEFSPLSEFADACLSLDFQTRITAEELVNVL